MSPLEVRTTSVIAGPNSAVWTGIRIALEGAGIEVCATAESAEELLAEVARTGPACCLIDIELSGGGIGAASQLARTAPRTAVILFTSKLGPEEFVDAVDAGAVGYVTTTISPERLPEVVRSVLAGELAFPRALLSGLIEHLSDRAVRRPAMLKQRRNVDLTAREWDVLALLHEGLTTHQMGAHLSISDVTVRRHIGTALKKLQVHSRGEALELLRSG